MKLVWTYNNKAKNLTGSNRIILVNYYILSINRAKKLGYYTVMYCSPDESKFWIDIADEVIPINGYEKSQLWDSFKFKVIEDRNDEFCLIDGDVLLHNNLPNFDEDIVFDSYEILNWKSEYESTVTQLTRMGISEDIDIWDDKRVNVISCGVLYIKNKSDRIKYVNLWKKFNDFINNHLDEVDTYRSTAVGAQFLLTLMVKKYNITHKNLSKNFGDKNEFYQHYFGKKKYISPLVATDKIIGKDFQIKVF